MKTQNNLVKITLIVVLFLLGMTIVYTAITEQLFRKKARLDEADATATMNVKYAVDGKEYTAQFDPEKIKVYYDPDVPSIARLYPDNTHMYGYLLLLVGAAMMLPGLNHLRTIL